MENNLISGSQQASSAQHGAKIRTYAEVVDYIAAHWGIAPDLSLQRMKALDAALNFPSKATPVILVSGLNGKSITIGFAAKLLQAEGICAMAYTTPQVLTFHERFMLDNDYISHKGFVDLANEVINTAEQHNIVAHSQELFAAMAFVYARNSKAEVALCEVAEKNGYDPITIAPACISAITRLSHKNSHESAEAIADSTKRALSVVTPGTYVVCGDQNKTILNQLQELTVAAAGIWMMPIRKVADLAYPFEQLHGRCAALAERICSTLLHDVLNRQGTKDGLLTRQKIQRGRPTTEEKRRQELNPRKTIEQFWKDTMSTQPAGFEILEKEKPTILLDSARNLDAFENLLLGIRLKHYQRPLKGLALVIAGANDTLSNETFVKMLRYFFKKTTGQVFLCPIAHPMAGTDETESWNMQAVADLMRDVKIKVRTYSNFEQAFEQACKSVDDKHGLVVVSGSHSIIQEYWHLKDIKKLAIIK